MRVLYFDAFSGVSGDMTVGALLALGLDFEHLRTELAKLPLPGYALRQSWRQVNGIRACKFDVDVDESGLGLGHGLGLGVESEPSHSREHDHDHRHGEMVGQAHAERSRHHHRAFREIRALIADSTLSASVKERAIAIFTTLAEAEGTVHGFPVDDVTFHEVGAIDSIVDIVGTAIGLVMLGIDHAYVSPLPLGSGMVRSQHGMIPVPGPATIELLRGFPARAGDGNGELITPTGAAIVRAIARAGASPMLNVERVGYGAGTKTFTDRPNLLRLLMGTIVAQGSTEEMVVVETNIDDANPEIYEYVMEQLFAAGARDVWLTPAQMKKNRPGTTLHALAEPGQRDAIAAVMLRETPSIGVRSYPVQRTALPREEISVETEFGTVRVKVARAPDGRSNLAPEYESCKQRARERRVPLKVVYQAALAAARKCA
jgi:uncharacterized protein (TIGR00299 family) protein